MKKFKGGLFNNEKIRTSCSGDTGGGLFTKELIDNETRYFLTGITSYGESCDKPW